MREAAAREIEEKIKSVKKLQESEGWKVVKEIMEQEVVSAAYSLSETPGLSMEEIHYRRGSMWAARKLLDLPTALLMKLENEFAIQVATEQSNSAKPSATADTN